MLVSSNTSPHPVCCCTVLQVIAGFDKCVLGLEEKQSRKLRIEPREAYGEIVRKGKVKAHLACGQGRQGRDIRRTSSPHLSSLYVFVACRTQV